MGAALAQLVARPAAGDPAAVLPARPAHRCYERLGFVPSHEGMKLSF